MRNGLRSGVTLVHLVLLLAVLTWAASAAIPAWFSRVDVTLENAAVLLTRDLCDARDRAAFQHREITVKFYADGDGYEVVGADGEPIEAPVGDGGFVRRYSRDAVFRGVSIESVEAGVGNALRFGPRGLALTGGRITVTFDDARRTVVLEEKTGDLTIEGMPIPSW